MIVPTSPEGSSPINIETGDTGSLSAESLEASLWPHVVPDSIATLA